MSPTERIVLPRLEDAVEHGKHLLRVHGATEWLVADVAYAFHNIPIRPSERQFVCRKVGTRFLVFTVLGMGGKSASNVQSLFAPAIGRVVSSVFSGDEFRGLPLLAGGGSLGEGSRTSWVSPRLGQSQSR